MFTRTLLLGRQRVSLDDAQMTECGNSRDQCRQKCWRSVRVYHTHLFGWKMDCWWERTSGTKYASQISYIQHRMLDYRLLRNTRKFPKIGSATYHTHTVILFFFGIFFSLCKKTNRGILAVLEHWKIEVEVWTSSTVLLHFHHLKV